MNKIQFFAPKKSLHLLFFLQLFALQFVTQQFITQDTSIIFRDISSTHCGSIDPIDSFAVIHNKIKLAQDQMHVGIFRRLQIVHDQDNHEQNNGMNFLGEQKYHIKLLLQFLLLLQPGFILISSDQVVEQIVAPTSEVYLECIPRHVHALPMTFATNLAGNGIAVAISSYAPTSIIAAAVACSLGCIGGLLESASSDTTYFSQNFIDIHRNLKTGFVADQVCVPVSTCFTQAIPNAAAVGAPVGYVTGLGTGYVIKSCKKNYDESRVSRAVAIELPPASTSINEMDR